MSNRYQLRVRPATPDDVPAIIDFNAAMAQETEGLSLDLQRLRQGVEAVLEDPARGCYFVAEVDGRVVGQLMITREWSDWRNGDIWWIQSVYVATAFRRQGVFSTLYAHVRARADESGAVGLRLYVEKDNAIAQRVYDRLGMRPAGYLVMERMSARGQVRPEQA